MFFAKLIRQTEVYANISFPQRGATTNGLLTEVNDDDDDDDDEKKKEQSQNEVITFLLLLRVHAGVLSHSPLYIFLASSSIPSYDGREWEKTGVLCVDILVPIGKN